MGKIAIHDTENSYIDSRANGKWKVRTCLANGARKNALIINTDSMQVYDVLNILTARPREADTAIVPHYLYGHVSPTLNYSVGQWLCDVQKLLATFSLRSVIFVGGTGLYFRALLEGISEIPHIPDVVRQKWRLLLDKEGVASLYRQLLQIDAVVAEKFLHKMDSVLFVLWKFMMQLVKSSVGGRRKKQRLSLRRILPKKFFLCHHVLCFMNVFINAWIL